MRLLKFEVLLTIALTSCGGGETVPKAAPEIQRVTANPAIAIAGHRVTFSAETTERVDDWSWNLGAQFFPLSSTSEQPDAFWAEPGTVQGSVTATNAIGSSAPFAFSFDVQAPTPPVWQAHVPFPTLENTIVPESFRASNGNPFVLSFAADPTLIFCYFATVPEPVQAGDWQRYAISAPARGPLTVADYAELGGMPALAYMGTDGQIWLLRAKVAHPMATSDWDFVEMISASDAVVSIRLGEDTGIPFAIAVAQTGVNQRTYMFYRANSSDPASTTDWSNSTIRGGYDSTPRYGVTQVGNRWFLHLGQDTSAAPMQPVFLLTAPSPLTSATSWSLVPLPEGMLSILGLWSAPPGMGIIGKTRESEGTESVFLSDSNLISSPASWIGYVLGTPDFGGRSFAVIDDRPIFTVLTDAVGLGGGASIFTTLVAFRSYSPRPSSAAQWREVGIGKPKGGKVEAGDILDLNGVPHINFYGQYAAPEDYGVGEEAWWFLTPDQPW